MREKWWMCWQFLFTWMLNHLSDNNCVCTEVPLLNLMMLCSVQMHWIFHLKSTHVHVMLCFQLCKTMAKASVDGAQATSMHNFLFVAICSEKPGGAQTKYPVDKKEVHEFYSKNVTGKVNSLLQKETPVYHQT